MWPVRNMSWKHCLLLGQNPWLWAMAKNCLQKITLIHPKVTCWSVLMYMIPIIYICLRVKWSSPCGLATLYLFCACWPLSWFIYAIAHCAHYQDWCWWTWLLLSSWLNWYTWWILLVFSMVILYFAKFSLRPSITSGWPRLPGWSVCRYISSIVSRLLPQWSTHIALLNTTSMYSLLGWHPCPYRWWLTSLPLPTLQLVNLAMILRCAG